MLDSGTNLVCNMGLHIEDNQKIYMLVKIAKYIYFFYSYFLVQQQTIMKIFVIQHVT